jgi:uncharacterized protein (TIGR02466 family)
MTTGIEVTDLFRYPLGIVKLNEDIKKLQQFCKNIEKNEKSIQASNKGGFQSPNNMQKYISDKSAYNKLYTKVYQLAGKFSGIFNLKSPIQYASSSLNINYPFSYNSLHTNLETIVSAIFYIKVPKNSGNIVFKRPDTLYGYLNNKNINLYNAFNTHHQTYTPKENELYLFPSWLHYEITQNLSKQSRISLIINFKCKE